MRKLLIVVDMQNDFITGTLGTPQAQTILPKVKEKIALYKENEDAIIFTRDTHDDSYLRTQEGRYLPVPHCMTGTEGHRIADALDANGCDIIDKPNFGSLELAERAAAGNYDEIELCGLCTDICVISNALILKARLPDVAVTVDAGCCAGVTEEGHNAALLAMKMCQVNILNV